MRKLIALLCIFFLLSLTSSIKAGHLGGGVITITHVQNNEYEIKLIQYTTVTDAWLGVFSAEIKIYQRSNAQYITSFFLPFTHDSIVPPIQNCGLIHVIAEKGVFVDTVTLSPSVYNHQSGYLFTFQQCCRPMNMQNIQSPGISGSSIVTLFPPLVDSLGSPIFNSSPRLEFPFSHFSVNQHVYFSDYGGTDPDGDSLVYSLYTPFTDAIPTPGTANSTFVNWADPATQIPGITWASTYNIDDQMHGFPGPNPSPNRLQIDSKTGRLTAIPKVQGPPFNHAIGIMCREYRNNELIGCTYRETSIFTIANQVSPNLPPQLMINSVPNFAAWNTDTLVFTASPVCLGLMVSDQNNQSDFFLEAKSDRYNSNEINISPNQGSVNAPNNFNALLCLNPDSFDSESSQMEVIVYNPGCYSMASDTLSFWVKFDGYSNAGYGGIKTIPMTSITGSIPLFPLLRQNPYTGGTWYDLDSNNHMSSNGFLDWKYVTQPKTYRFIYVQQESNFPPDTANLTLNFVYPSSLIEDHQGMITVYPNPSGGKFTLRTDDLLLGKRIEIYSMDMKLHESSILKRNESQFRIEESGIYFMKIEDLAKVRKVIIE